MSAMRRVRSLRGEENRRAGGSSLGRPGALRIASLLAAVLLLLVPEVGSAEKAKWNQTRVTNIATQLAEASDNVYDKVLKLQSPPPGGPWSSFYRFKENTRVIKNSADYLAKRLQAGGGHDETYPTFRRMMVLIRDAQENGRRMGIIPDDTLAAITHAGDLVRQLRPYYEDTSKPEKKGGAVEEE